MVILPEGYTFVSYDQTTGTHALPLVLEGYAALQNEGNGDPAGVPNWNDRVLLILRGVEPVAVLTYQELGWADAFHISLGYVKPAHRRQGLYRALWEELVRRARGAKRARIQGGVAWTNAEMRSVAEALGRRPQMVSYAFDVPPEED